MAVEYPQIDFDSLLKDEPKLDTGLETRPQIDFNALLVEPELASSRAVTSSYVDPNSEAEKVVLARKLQETFNEDWSPMAVDPAEARRRLGIAENERILSENPILSRKFTDSTFANITHKDLNNLGSLERTVTGTMGDIGVTTVKGLIGVPQFLVGLANIPTFGYAGKGLEAIGIDLAEAQDILDTMYSPAQQAANRRVQQAEGFIDTLTAAIENPSTILTTVGESLPSMFGGGAIGRALLGAGSRVLGAGMAGPTLPGYLARVLGERGAGIVAGAAGEGLVAAGTMAEQIRAESEEGLLTGKQALASLGAGFGTGVIGAVGGKAAQKLKLTDIDTLIAEGGEKAAQASVAKTGFMRNVIGSGIAEGVFEELPQSAQEQMWQNWAQDRPVLEGVGSAAAMGFLAGAATGSGAATVKSTADRLQQARDAETMAQRIEQITQLARASQVLAADPQTFRDFMQDVGEASDIRELFVDARVLAQRISESGVPVQQLEAAMPGITQQITTAAALNESVAIPLADFATHIAPTPLADALVPDLRTEGGMSVTEARAVIDNAAEEFRGAIETLQTTAQQDATFRKSFRAVRDSLEGQIAAASPIYSRQDARAAATLEAARYAALGRQLGISPEEAMQRFPAAITGEGMMDQQGPLLNQPWDMRQDELPVPPVIRDLGGDLFKPHTLEDRKAGAPIRFKNPIRLSDGTRLSGFTKYDQAVFYGYDKNGEAFTWRREFVDPALIESSRDSNQTAEQVRQGLQQLTDAGQLSTQSAELQNALRQKGFKPGPDAPGVGLEEGNKLGFWPQLRVKLTAKLKLPEKALILTGTTNANAAKQIDAIDGILKKFPKATESTAEWTKMMAYALGSTEVPIPPYAFIRDLNGTGAVDKLRTLTQGQIDDADHGFENAAEFRRAYVAGELGVETTGKLFMWSFLSRGVSPYTQEALFIDAFEGADKWIAMAARGEFTEAVFPEYEAWAKSVAPAGSGQPGAGATHNLNAFGQDFLFKMSRVGSDGKTHMQRLHDMMSDPTQTGKQIRREFATFGEGVGIDNKVVSFTLLVAGFNDVMVLDRVQIRQLWDDGKFNGINLYDGMSEVKMVMGKDGVAKEKRVKIAGSSLNGLAEGVRGILVYEAIERGLETKIKEMYSELGRPQDASIGRYHWESWVADSQQEASHATLGAILEDAKGNDNAIAQVSAKQGEYGAYEYGALYNRDATGMPWFGYQTPQGGNYAFSVSAFRAFLNDLKPKGVGVVPRNFLVTESGNAPWYTRPEVNQDLLEERARYWADLEGGSGEGQRAIEETLQQQAADSERSGAADQSIQGGINERLRQAGNGRGRYSGGAIAPLAGAPSVPGFSGPDPRLVAVAEQYARDNGIDLRRQSEYAKVDPERAARIAAAYEAMPHSPQDPTVREAYENLIRQTTAQYQALVDAGYRFWFIDPNNPANTEYISTPWNAMRDLRANQEMGVFPTNDGFGSDSDFSPEANPLLADTGFEWPVGGPDGPMQKVLANDLFRAVHDAFGHGLEGAGFRAQGEENAWQAHVRLFTGSAVGAITTETRGQNSWLNFGPFGETNRTASVQDTVFADQKTGLMPEWTWTEGRVGDQPDTLAQRGMRISPAAAQWAEGTQVVDETGQPAIMYVGRGRDVTEFQPGQAEAIYVTPDPGFASGFAMASAARNDIGAANVLPVIVRATNIFDPANPAHREGLRAWLTERYGENGIVVIEAPKVPPMRLTPAQLAERIASGNWMYVESPIVQEYVRAAGHDGFWTTERKVRNLGVFNSNQIKSVFNQAPTAAPGILEQAADETRGYYDPQRMIAVLTSNADFSTLHHEMFHHTFNVYAQLAQDPNGPAQIREDFLTMLKNFNVPDLTTWRGMSFEEQRRIWEGTAYQHEIYLSEGKAPSEEIKGVFDRISKWIRDLYRDVIGRLNTLYRDEFGEDLPALTPEVRAVFDRMFASEQEIARAEQAQGMAPMFKTQAESGMDDATWAAYQTMWQEPTDRAVSDLQRNMIREMLRLAKMDIRKTIQREVRDELLQTPIYGAQMYLRTGRRMVDGEMEEIEGMHRLDVDVLKDMYGPGSDIDYKQLYFMYSENGLDPRDVASMFGFENADQMVRALLSAPKLAEAVETRTNERMEREYGELNTPEAIEAKVNEAVHNELRARLITVEYRYLSKASESVRNLMEAVRQAASDMVARKKVSELRPREHINAETKAGQRAVTALQEGNLDEQAKAKRDQMLQNRLAAETLAAKDEVNKILRKFRRLQSAGSQKNMRGEARVQLNNLLARFDLRVSRSLKDIQATKVPLGQFLQSEADRLSAFLPELPDWILDADYRQSYKELTMEQLRQLDRFVSYFENLARREQKQYQAVRNQTYKQEVESILAELLATNPGAFEADGTPKRFEKLMMPLRKELKGRFQSEFDAQFINLENILDVITGGKGKAIFESLFGRLSRAQDERSAFMKRLGDAINEATGAYSVKERLEMTLKKELVPGTPYYLTRENRIAIALFYGSETGRQRLMDGNRMTEAQIQAVLATLDEKDVNLIKTVYRLSDEIIWPELKAVNERTAGIAPEKVKAMPFMTPHGMIDGGYVPLVYDGEMSARTHDLQTNESVQELLGGTQNVAATQRSASKARLEKVNRDLSLSLRAIAYKLNETVHDITHREAVADTYRLLQNTGVQNALRYIAGPAVYNMFLERVREVAVKPRTPSGFSEKTFWYLRRNTMINMMGASVNTVLLNVLGVFPAVRRVGGYRFLRAMGQLFGERTKLQNERYEWILQKSIYMRERTQGFDRDLNAELSRLNPSSILPGLDFWFAGLSVMDRMITMPTWLAAYEKGMEVHANDEKAAVDYADRVVRQTAGGGRALDLAKVAGGVGIGGELKKAITMYMNFFLAQLGMLRRGGAIAGREWSAGKKAAAAGLVTLDVMLIIVLPAALEAIARGNCGEDPEASDYLYCTARSSALFVGNFFPIFRDVLPFMWKQFDPEVQNFGVRFTPIQSAVETLGRLPKATVDILSGEGEQTDLRDMVKGIGYAVGLPGFQAWRTIDGARALMEGETENPAVILTGPPKD